MYSQGCNFSIYVHGLFKQSRVTEKELSRAETDTDTVTATNLNGCDSWETEARRSIMGNARSRN